MNQTDELGWWKVLAVGYAKTLIGNLMGKAGARIDSLGVPHKKSASLDAFS